MTLRFGLLYRVGGMSESDDSHTITLGDVFGFVGEPLKGLFGLLDGFRRTEMVDDAASFGDFESTGGFKRFSGSSPLALIKENAVSPNDFKDVVI
jgi:hypothetical protein